MNNLKKTLLLTIIFSFIAIFIASYIRITAISQLNLYCSYLNPLIIDILATLFAIFLILEGSFRIYEHPNAILKRQYTRIMRIVIGFAILTLHTFEFFYG
ncbi:MAG: hypothetical protein WC867_00890 [Candidatus Pacearchaeota archaeon]|jgi:hypothetical protein